MRKTVTAVQPVANDEAPVPRSTEERTIPAPSTASGANGELHLGLLPDFVTPDWLADNHHLMKADLRKLAAAVAEDYPDWPAAADGSDEAAFWHAVHAYAGRWTWFLWLFEERIVKLLGRVKGRRKQLLPGVLKSAGGRARELRPVRRSEAEPGIEDDLETLREAGEHVLVAEVVWVLSCLDAPDLRLMIAPWLDRPEIDNLVGRAVRHADPGSRAVRGDLVERLCHEATGTHLERLAAAADAECAALEREMADVWDQVRELVAEHTAYRPAADTVSRLLSDLETAAVEFGEIEAARNGALARCRHATLRALLEGALKSMPGKEFGKEADALKRRVGAILEDGGLPLRFPDSEWGRCEDRAARFRAAVVEPGEHEIALRAAAERYAADPSAENRDALHAASAAERKHPRSSEPATAALDDLAACLAELVERFGSMADRAGAAEFCEAGPRDPESPLRTEIDELKAANREAKKRNALLEQALGDAGRENDELRAEKHRLVQRLAALKNGEPAEAAERRIVPPLPGYAELPAWVEEHFSGRVALAGRALRALKGAGFEDVELVGRAIELLATSYRQMKGKGGKQLRDAFEEELRALRLQETPSFTSVGQGRAREDWAVEWDGRRLTLDRHLKNNAKTRNPRLCFRLYFAWDEASRQVVIGHLPGHMKT